MTNEFRVKQSTIQDKLRDQLSSLSQRKFDSIEYRLYQILDNTDITEAEKNLIYIQLSKVICKKPASYQYIQKGGKLTTEYTQQLIQKKD